MLLFISNGNFRNFNRLIWKGKSQIGLKTLNLNGKFYPNGLLQIHTVHNQYRQLNIWMLLLFNYYCNYFNLCKHLVQQKGIIPVLN
jgi:hypothetical protein